MIVVKAGLCCACNDLRKGKKKKKQYRRQPTGELEVFMQIWKDRPHVSEVSGKPLLPIGHPDWIKQFSHILSKGAFPAFRLYKDNIKLVLPDEHQQWETGSRDTLRQQPEWNWVFEEYEILRIEYFQKADKASE